MLKKLLVAGFVVLLVINLCGCNSESVQLSKPSMVAETVVSSSSESKGEATSITHSKQIETKTQVKNIVETIEKQESVTENKVSKGNERVDESESTASHHTEKQESNNKNSTKSEEKDTPTTSKPKTETQKETVKPITKKEKPTQVPKPTEAKKESSVNISYYVGYAQSYASSVGLSLDCTAVDCWDNPISVNANRSGIESDIISRLNRYRNIEGFTSVWVWSEQVSSSEYNLYIGYA